MLHYFTYFSNRRRYSPADNDKAAIAEGRTLEGLMPECQQQILTNASSPQDLYNMIRASPRLYQVFALNRKHVLSAVARSQFHPAVLQDALTFAKISEHKPPLSGNTARGFCQLDLSTLTAWRDEVASPSMSATMFKLASNIRFFIEEYARYTLPIMEDIGHGHVCDFWSESSSDNPIEYSMLSASEVGRLQRAFCRFEVYRSLFARCSIDFDHASRNCYHHAPIRTKEQAKLYLAKFPDFQIAEINCVRDYLDQQLRWVCFYLEEDAFKTLTLEAFNFGKHDDLGTFKEAVYQSSNFIFTTTGKYRHDIHREHLMSLGLPYIRRILESTGEVKRDLFARASSKHHIHINILWDSQFITNAFKQLYPDDQSLLPTPTNVVSDALGIPDAWKWAHPDPLELVMAGDLEFIGLRSWGYVFWDKDRLQKSGMPERDVEDIRTWMLHDEVFEFDANPSVQQRLRNKEKLDRVSWMDEDEDTGDILEALFKESTVR